MALKSVSKQDIINQVNIVDIAEEFEIDLESISSGNFNWRCKCPAKDHKGGLERTPSLYIDSINNNYYCYGCQSSFNCLDFYMICADVSFSEALSILRERVKPTGKKSFEIKRDNLPIIMEISKLFRETIYSHPKDLKWINGTMQKTDSYLSNIKRSDIKKTNKLLASIKMAIRKRYDK